MTPPDGQISPSISFAVQPLSKKYSDFQKTQITFYPQPSRSPEGRCATSRNAERDAVDAGGALDGRCGWRTAKSCGPDAPTLASSWRIFPPATVAKKPGHRGARRKPLKPLRAGMPVVPVYSLFLVCVLPPQSAHEAAGAAGTRHSPRPLWAGDKCKPRALSAARTKSYPKLYQRHCERSEAIHSFFAW